MIIETTVAFIIAIQLSKLACGLGFYLGHLTVKKRSLFDKRKTY